MKFSQKSVTYHGCGSCYLDDANIIESKSKLCFFPTHEPFWKDPKDVSNKIAKSTRNQLKEKTIASRNYRKKYFRYQRYNGKGIDTTISDHWTSSSEDSDETYYSDDDESILNSNADIKTENTIKKGETFEVVKGTAPMIIINSENNVSNNELTRRNQVYYSSSNVSTDTTDIVKD